ncbi:VOC family protein [Patescibacteria group bacterium]|nr:VOC family protein [Patescibacteria group bacterium]MCL5797306.1 VOC family protein [Patescibacteria group bacterium]
MSRLHPYLNFNGQGFAAMNFYHSIFGGELKTQSYGESGQARKESEKKLLMHAELKTDNFTILASDGNEEHKVTMGNSVNMCLVGNEAKQLTDYFNKLAEGGKITMPLAKQFWGDTYGMLTDKFGIHWMVNISAK